MMILIDIYILILGLCLGSFYNVVGLRVLEGESLISPPSHCPSCGRRLSFIDLVPVFSYALLRGKCRTCHSRISPLYPFVEASTGILFLLAFLFAPSLSDMVVGWLLISILMIILVTDINKMMIPDKIMVFFFILFFIFRCFVRLEPWWDSLLGMGVGFGLLMLIFLVSRGKGMGGGDINLFAVMGLLVGTKMILLGFFFSTFYGALIGMIGMALGKFKRNKPLPFGPFIALGMLTAYFFGETLLDLYLDLFLW
ncbi:prepilin peptidase [Terrilactibacillus laevilacticus]|nr:A24 family peptidase [Terrilactibacillus laevilacticus]